MSTTCIFTILEQDLHLARLESAETKGNPCHCLVAQTLFRETGVPPITVSTVAARLQDGTRISFWYENFVVQLIAWFDEGRDDLILPHLPVEFIVEIHEPNTR